VILPLLDVIELVFEVILAALLEILFVFVVMLVDIPDVGWQLAHIPYAIWLLVDIPEVG
jgi:hypothetical protein